MQPILNSHLLFLAGAPEDARVFLDTLMESYTLEISLLQTGEEIEIFLNRPRPVTCLWLDYHSAWEVHFPLIERLRHTAPNFHTPLVVFLQPNKTLDWPDVNSFVVKNINYGRFKDSIRAAAKYWLEQNTKFEG